MFNKKSPKKQYYMWLGSYMLIAFLAVVINIFGYSSAIRVVTDEVKKTNGVIAEKEKNIYDNCLNDVGSSAYNVLQTNFVKQLSFYSEISAERRNECIISIRDYMQNYIVSNRMIENMVLIVKKKNMCIASDGLYNISAMYESHFKKSYASEKEWLDDVFNTNLRKYIFLRDSDGTGKMMFIQLLTSTGKTDTAIVVRINGNRTTDLLLNAKKDNEDCFIITDKENNPIFSADKISSMNIKGNTAVINGRKYIISSEKSDTADIHYIYAVPRTKYLARLIRIRSIYIISFVLCMLICGAAAFVFSKINYRNKLKTDTRLKEQTNQLRRNVLRNVLLGKAEGISQELLNKYNISFFADSKIAIAVFEELVGDETKTDFASLEKLIKKKLEENGIFTTYFTEINDFTVCVFASTDSDIAARATAAFESADSELAASGKNRFVCALGPVTESPLKLCDIYSDVIETMAFRLLEQSEVVLMYSDKFSQNSYKYDIETETRLMNMLSAGNAAEAHRLVDSIFEENVNVLKINLSSLRILTSEIINTIIKAAASLETNDKIDYKNIHMAALNVVSIKRYKEAQNSIYGLIDAVCACKAEKDMCDSRIDGIKDYINENYSNPDITVSFMAEKFNLSAGYLSTYFKEKTGTGLAEYIIKCRIDHAKSLLLGGFETIGRISELVGFSSTIVFQRAFKRCEGVTPKQYRDSANN